MDLYAGQIRDHVGLRPTIELLTGVHRTATAVFLDGDKHGADPTSPDHRAA